MWMCVLPMTFRETVHTVAVVTRRIICIVPALAVPTVIVPARILVVILAPILIIPPPILITPTLATPITQPDPLKSMPFMTES